MTATPDAPEAVVTPRPEGEVVGMSLLESFSWRSRTSLGSKMRTLLTMLGIIIGVCAVIVIVGLGNGMQGYIEDSFADMGTNTLTVTIMGRGSSRTVSRGGDVSASWRTTPTIWTRSRPRCP